MAPALGDLLGEPARIDVGSGLIGLDGFLFPIGLTLHAAVRLLQPQALDIARQGLDALHTEPLEGRHDGARPRVAGIDEVGMVPVVRVLAALLGEVHPGALGAQLDRLVGHIVPGLGDPLRADVPVEGPDRLAVAVHAAVLKIDFTSGRFLRRAAAEDLRGGGILLDIRPIDHDQHDGGQQRQCPEQDGGRGHSHKAAPRLKYNDRITL